MIEKYLNETPYILKEMIKNEKELFDNKAKEIVNNKIMHIILTGSGTSYHAGLISKEFLMKVTNLYVEVLYPFQINKFIFKECINSLLIGISQEGASLSTYKAMEFAKKNNSYTASMSANEDAYINEEADYIFRINCGEELFGPKTKGYHATILNILLLGMRIGLNNGTISDEEHNSYINDINNTIDNMSSIINESKQWILNNSDELKLAHDLKLIGSKDNYGNVMEGALKILETFCCPTTGYEFEEFVHGIQNSINKDSYIILLNSGKEVSRINTLIEILRNWTSHVFVIGKDLQNKTSKDFSFKFINNENFLIFEYILPIEMMCHIIPPLRNYDKTLLKDPMISKKMESKKVI